MFNEYDNFNMPEVDFGVKSFGHSLDRWKRNYIWPLVAAAAVTAVGSIISSAAAPSGGTTGEIAPSTVSGNTVIDSQMLFDVDAEVSLDNLITEMNGWAAEDRTFFSDVYEPFQNALIESNKELLPDIVAGSGEALKQNLTDLMGSDTLKNAFRKQVNAEGGNISKFSAEFSQMVDQIPTAEQRVGQAISGLEQKFGQAGAELKRQMGAKGLDVSEASLREMAIGKASAKASLTDQANEGARLEKLNALEKGLGVSGGVQESQANMLGAARTMDQAAANLNPQIGGVKDQESISAASIQGSTLLANDASKVLGQAEETKDATFTRKGLAQPRFFDKDTGAIVSASGGGVEEAKFEQNKLKTDWLDSLSPEDREVYEDSQKKKPTQTLTGDPSLKNGGGAGAGMGLGAAGVSAGDGGAVAGSAAGGGFGLGGEGVT